jgi:hypothetical protein
VRARGKNVICFFPVFDIFHELEQLRRIHNRDQFEFHCFQRIKDLVKNWPAPTVALPAFADEPLYSRKNEIGNDWPFVSRDQRTCDLNFAQVFRECRLASHEFIQNQSK